jgi:hypothetical protein
MVTEEEFVCQHAMPGWACNMPEMSVLGILFFLESVFCLFCFVSEYRRFSAVHPNSPTYCHMTSDVVFWVSLCIWCVYEGIIRSVYFPYNSQTFNLFYNTLVDLAYLVPLSSLIMMICEFLIDYRGSSKRVLMLFRIIFAVFFVAFIVLGTGLSLLSWTHPDDPESQTALWHGCTDLIISVFVGAPAFALMRIIAFPVVPVENRKCFSTTKGLTIVFCTIIILRCLYNITHGLNCNPLNDWFANQVTEGKRLSWKARLFAWVFVFIFDFCSSVAVIIGVRTWRANDVKFADKSFYNAEIASTNEAANDARIGERL